VKLLDLLLKIMKNSSNKTTNGWTMTGICSQWAKRNNEISPNEFAIYTDILDKSFSQKRRWCYMSYDDMSLSRATTSKTLKSLEDKGIISRKQTYKDNGHKSKVEYKILEPMKYIKNFTFLKNASKEQEIKKEELSEDEEVWQ
jgi:predicted transcriptional regulator